jgi:hypothetical protein
VTVVLPAFRPAIANRRAFAALALAAAGALVAPAARASGPLLFQHGGRATAQVGAFVGRATDAGGIDYNPGGDRAAAGLALPARLRLHGTA